MLVGIGGRASGLALRPVTGAVGGAARIGVRVERRAVDRVLDSGELKRILIAGLDSALVQDAFRRALASEGAGRLVDSFFESGLFDHFIARLRASDALWRLVDRIAQSPSVLATLSRQSLGFADQTGGAVRDRSRRAEYLVERAARRRSHPNHNEVPRDPDATA